MKITVLGINYSPELTGIGVYTAEMCEYLNSKSHAVTVFTGFPYYPQWKISEKYRGKYFFAENNNGVKVRRSFVYVPNKVNTKARIIHEISFIISSFFNVLFSSKPDIIIAIAPPLGMGIVAYIISKIKKVPFIFHVQDLQPDAAVDLNMIKSKKIIKLLFKIEKYIYEKAARISLITEKMAERVLTKGVDRKKIIIFPNWVDAEKIKPLLKDNVFIRRNNLENKFIVLYSGNIGYKQGVEVIVDVADMTKNNENIIYVIAGSGNYKNELIGRFNELKLNNIKFLPVQSKDMYLYMLSAAAVCLVPQRKVVKDIVMPSKLLAIMACGCFTIAGANEGSKLYNVIESAGCGIITEPEDAKQIVDAIEYVYNNREKGIEKGRKGREYVIRHFSKDRVLEDFEKNIMKVIRRSKRKV